MKLPREILTYLADLYNAQPETAGYREVNIPDTLLQFFYSEHENQAIQQKPGLYDKLMTLVRTRRRKALGRKTAGKLLEKHDILVFFTEPSHFRQLEPVLAELERKKLSFLAVTNKHDLFNRMKKLTPHCAFIHPGQVNEADEGARTMLQQFTEKVTADVKLQGQLSAKTTGEVAGIIRREGIKALAQVHFWQHRLPLITPRIIVTGNDFTRDGRVLTYLGKAKGIHTITIQHGLIPLDNLHSHHISDRILVYGNKSRENLVKLGISSNTIAVAGAPYLDHEKDLVYRQNGASQKKISRVLVGFSGSGHRTSEENHTAMVDAMMELAHNHPGISFTFKLHKKDKPAYYEKNRFYRPGANMAILYYEPGKKENIFEVIKGYDVLVTGSSAIALEAMLLGKPVFTLDFKNDYRGIDFIDAESTIHCTDKESLFARFDALVKGTYDLNPVAGKAIGLLKEYFEDTGSASANYVDLIRQTLQSH